MEPAYKIWKNYFEKLLDIDINIVDVGSDDHFVLKEFGILEDKCNGCYIPEAEKVVVVRHDDEQAFKTLVHECCHALFERGFIHKAVKGYRPPLWWVWIYPPEQRKEEAIVESIALWATNNEADFSKWLQGVVM